MSESGTQAELAVAEENRLLTRSERRSPEARRLRRMNRRMAWKKGNYRLIQVGALRYRRSVRRDVVVSLIKTRQWRLAATVVLMPNGYSLTFKEKL